MLWILEAFKDKTSITSRLSEEVEKWIGDKQCLQLDVSFRYDHTFKTYVENCSDERYEQCNQNTETVHCITSYLSWKSQVTFNTIWYAYKLFCITTYMEIIIKVHSPNIFRTARRDLACWITLRCWLWSVVTVFSSSSTCRLSLRPTPCPPPGCPPPESEPVRRWCWVDRRIDRPMRPYRTDITLTGIMKNTKLDTSKMCETFLPGRTVHTPDSAIGCPHSSSW